MAARSERAGMKELAVAGAMSAVCRRLEDETFARLPLKNRKKGSSWKVVESIIVRENAFIREDRGVSLR